MRPRVLIVTHYWRPHVGGIETVAIEQAQRLAARDWDVTVATSRLAGDASRERSETILVRRYSCCNLPERTLNVPVPLMSLTMLTELRRLGSSVDVIVAHGHAFIGSIYAALAARRLSKPFVLVQHSPFVEYPLPLRVLERVIDRTLGRYVIRTARQVIAVSTFTEKFVRAIEPTAPITVVHSAVDRDRFSPSCSPLEEHPGDRVVFLTVRRLVPRNGVDTLVNAWRAAGVGLKSRLVIAGDGPEREKIRRIVGEDPSIELRGFVPDDELPDTYRSSDVFVLPSISGEGFGLVVAEAMSSGLAVIATRCGGISDLVQNGQSGLLVDPDDIDSLAHAIKLIADDGALRGRLREGALEKASWLSWDRSIDRLETILTDALT